MTYVTQHEVKGIDYRIEYNFEGIGTEPENIIIEEAICSVTQTDVKSPVILRRLKELVSEENRELWDQTPEQAALEAHIENQAYVLPTPRDAVEFLDELMPKE